MAHITYKELLKTQNSFLEKKNMGDSDHKNIDKTGVFYHVITKAFDGGTIFYKDTGDYRHNLLCRLCEERGITLLFSVTMPNHTHDVFLTPDWSLLAEVLRILNLNLVKQIRFRNPKRFREGTHILRRHPTYVVIRDIRTLFYVGKYIFDNPSYIQDLDKHVPHSCFWMFEREYFVSAYDETIYRKLFGLTPKQLFDLYSTSTKDEVRQYAETHFKSWSDSLTHQIFYRS